MRVSSKKQGNLLGVLPCFFEWITVVKDIFGTAFFCEIFSVEFLNELLIQEEDNSEAKEVDRYFHSGLESKNHKYFFCRFN